MDKTTVITIRVPLTLDRRIDQAARRRRSTKSAILRETIATAFAEEGQRADPAAEARRQSLLVSGRESERDAIEFIEHVADHKGWQ